MIDEAPKMILFFVKIFVNVKIIAVVVVPAYIRSSQRYKLQLRCETDHVTAARILFLYNHFNRIPEFEVDRKIFSEINY